MLDILAKVDPLKVDILLKILDTLVSLIHMVTVILVTVKVTHRDIPLKEDILKDILRLLLKDTLKDTLRQLLQDTRKGIHRETYLQDIQGIILRLLPLGNQILEIN